LEMDQIDIHFDNCLGSGTYGDVYEATITGGRDKGMSAVVKRAKEGHVVQQQDLMQGAIKDGFFEGGSDQAAMSESMLAVESFMGRKTTEACPQFVPRFLGEMEAEGSRWLAWERVEGNSLEDLFEEASAAASLKPVADALGLFDFEDESAESLASLAEEVARQLFEGVWSLERAGIAHRDIKPENILVAGQRLVLIDFGSAACMGEYPHIGYDYNVAPCDANYCPPERFIDEAEWNKYDVYSCAMVLMRLLMPPLRGDSEFRKFRDTLFAVDDDLDTWFSATILTDTAVQAIRAQPPFGLTPAARIHEYERIATLSCALEEGEGEGAMCPLKDGLTVLKHRSGLHYETLRALLAHEPSHRPTAQQALYSLG